MNTSYDYYRVFYYAGLTGSFTKAAQMLSTGQPNVTRAVNLLEAQLGVRLFDRTKKGIRFTEEGRRLYERVRIACEQLAAAEQEIEAAKNLCTGTVTIGASEIALHELLLPALPDFRREHPGVVIRITNESTPSAVRSLEKGLVDLALVTTPVPEAPRMHTEMLKTFTEIPVAAENAVALPCARPGIAELAKLPLIMLAEGTGTRRYYNELFARHGCTLTPQIAVSTADQIMPMVRAGLGIGFVTRGMFTPEPGIREIPLADPLPPRRICLVYGKEKTPSVAVQALAARLRQPGAPEPEPPFTE